jgi:hypothetical protein
VKPSPEAEVTTLAAQLRGDSETPGQGLVAPDPRRDIVSFARQELEEDPATEAGALRLAFRVLSLQPDSALFENIRGASASAFRRYGRFLEPYVDADDLVARVRERTWRASGTALRDLIGRGWLASFLRRSALWVALDELRAMARRPRTPFDELSEEVETPALAIDDAVDLRALLAKLQEDVPSWAADVVVSLLLDEVDATRALRTVNERRRERRLPPWTETYLRVWLHRLRRRLRELAVSPSEP